jgi:putative cardiolipin synthase
MSERALNAQKKPQPSKPRPGSRQPFLVLLTGLLLIVGCASSPPRSYYRTPSVALEGPESTSLGQAFKTEMAANPGESGILLVPSGEWAFRSRAGLANLAERTIDVQYYIWEVDTTGRILAERLLRAADRGVRVRMLLDHITTKDTDFRFAGMAAHPNIEVRLFNPFETRGFRNIELITDLNRLNHRMHNKAFIVDNAMAVVGGRNVGDNYFGVDATTNFRDLDLAVVGPVVQEISHSFDQFWNSEFAAPIDAVVDETLTEQAFEQQKQRLYQWVDQIENFPYPIDLGGDAVLARLEALGDTFVWAPAKALYDLPDKLSTREEDLADHLIDIGKRKDHEVIIESAYVIPGPAGIERARQTQAQNIRQRLLTNSLATNDVAAAHAGYAKYRFDLIRSGVDLYELRPDARLNRENWSLLGGKSKSSLHTKAFVVDRELVAIGSFNVDPRSIQLNTEIVILVDSREVADLILAYMDQGTRPENSYHVVLAFDEDIGAERLVWITEDDGQEVRYHSDPEVGPWRRFTAWMIGLLPIEEHL